MKRVNGLHHITAIAGRAQENLDFYAGVLGMRLVKKSVNQDDPGTYHLFYADAEGRPGTDLTFFPWAAAGAAARRAWAGGRGRPRSPADSLMYWGGRLEKYGARIERIETRFGERVLPLNRSARAAARARRGGGLSSSVHAVGRQSGRCRTAGTRSSRRAAMGARRGARPLSS